MKPSHRMRRVAVLLHRWVGLCIALFLLLAGVSGTLLAFNDEIEGWLNPQLFYVTPPSPAAAMLDPLELRERLSQRHPQLAFNGIDFTTQPGHAMLMSVEGSPEADQWFVNPYDASVLGTRHSGDLSQGTRSLMPFVNELHTSLALGEVGTLVLGVVALLWTLDCVVGFYLTLPLAIRQPGQRSYWQRWQPAWLLRWRAGAAKLTFDLHRAAGLWFWGMLLVLAWSSVAFNLAPVYTPVMRLFSDYQPEPDRPTPRVAPAGVKPLGWYLALDVMRQEMARLAAQQHFTVRSERLMFYSPEQGIYEYRVLSTLDPGDRMGNTTLLLDAYSGNIVQRKFPTGEHAGNTITAWLMALHTVTTGGMLVQLLVSITGIVVALLSVTGVLIWLRRYRARRVARH
ncbi:PepSY domain-containing protein [Duganella sp. FT135W]|uniref:PepSY domain-containing protein n=1 Tax=Duganella flavida TaxID=2692175 RepID=A0A6L8KK49_9BURK|nr:PepSY-associated TM helix domain-containing protein [Duganella flavida]MYM24921.1 PepSY domain-containing protein [Duganella flavida]